MSETEVAIWCVIPVKGFARAKSRLSPLLSESERLALARDMFSHVHSVCMRHADISGVLIATDDPDVAALVTEHELPVVMDEVGAPFNVIVDHALGYASELGATHAIVLMSDLPCLVREDIDALVASAEGGKLVVAPDRSRHGTNALLLSLPAEIGTCFGRADSFQAHLAAADGAGVPMQVCDRAGIALDLDTPEDYAAVIESLRP